MSIFRTDFESLLDPSERGNQVQYQPAIQEAQELRVLEPEKDSNEAMIAVRAWRRRFHRLFPLARSGTGTATGAGVNLRSRNITRRSWS